MEGESLTWWSMESKDELLEKYLRPGTVRKLLPKEALKLQGIDDETIDKLLRSGLSDTQLYRAAGDGATVPVIYEIAKRIINADNAEKEQGENDKAEPRCTVQQKK